MQHDGIGLVRLDLPVAGDLDRQTLLAASGGKHHQAAGQHASNEVVRVGRTAQAIRNGRLAGQVATASQQEGERRRAVVAFGQSCLLRGNRHRRQSQHVVVLDRSRRRSDRQRGVGRIGEMDCKLLVDFDGGVARYGDGDHLLNFARRKGQRSRGQGAAKVGSVDRLHSGAGDGVVNVGDAAAVASAGDGEAESGSARIALRLVGTQRGNGQRRWGWRIIVQDGALGRSRGDRGIAGVAQRHREALVRFHGGVAADVDRDSLARLVGCEADRTARQRAAEVVGTGGTAATAGHHIGYGGGASQIASAGDNKAEGGRVTVAFGPVRVNCHNR